MVPVTARYDAVANSYAPGADRYEGSAVSTLLDLIGTDVGGRVLDLACGHGLVARELARRGASVEGIDLSHELLERARSHHDGANLAIEYIHGDVTDPDVLEGAEFNLVVRNGCCPLTSTHSRGAALRSTRFVNQGQRQSGPNVVRARARSPSIS
jgi:2-polyprenyl-3-methyl-5-hydroxy-6-metoxy-1,4-benzoquinol methylase